MIRNDVFVQRGIRAVKLRQLSVGAFLRINTVVILLGDVIRGQTVGGSSRNGGV